MTPQRTLADSMGDLSLEDSRPAEVVSNCAKRSPVAQKLARWPRLPEDWEKSDRYFVLGWSVEHPRLQKFVKLSTAEELAHVPYLLRAPDLLELACDWENIQLCTVLPQDASPPEPWDDPNGPRDILIAIAFTVSKRLYETRPTKEQYGYLKRIFGCRPQWYRDAFPKEYFYLHGISR